MHVDHSEEVPPIEQLQRTSALGRGDATMPGSKKMIGGRRRQSAKYVTRPGPYENPSGGESGTIDPRVLRAVARTEQWCRLPTDFIDIISEANVDVDVFVGGFPAKSVGGPWRTLSVKQATDDFDGYARSSATTSKGSPENMGAIGGAQQASQSPISRMNSSRLCHPCIRRRWL